MTHLFPDRESGGLLYQAPAPPEEWEGEHTCQCAVAGIGAPCGHCTDCPVCNCEICEDWHSTADGETCPHAETEPREGHTMPSATTETITQHGLRFPDGSVRWAAGSVDLTNEGHVNAPEVETTATSRSAYQLNLREVLADKAAASHLRGQLEDLAKAAHTDPEKYLKDCRIVTRTIIVVVQEPTIHEIPAKPADSTVQPW